MRPALGCFVTKKTFVVVCALAIALLLVLNVEEGILVANNTNNQLASDVRFQQSNSSTVESTLRQQNQSSNSSSSSPTLASNAILSSSSSLVKQVEVANNNSQLASDIRFQQNNISTGESTTDSPSSSPTLASNATLSSSSSPLKQVEVNSKEVTKSGCHISSYGKDGVGHQMEAKISCLVTASALNWTYVHQPMREAEHGTDSVAMENLFGVSQALPFLPNAVLYDNSTMRLTDRKQRGRCKKNTWFDTFNQTSCDEDATNKDSKVAIPVYSSDNCWDYFWCNLDSFPSQWWETMLPALRDSFLRGLSGHKSTDNHDGKLLVVMHMRMGDARKRKADKEWCKLVLRNLLDAASLNDEQVQVNVHSDATHKVVNDMLELDDIPMKDSVTIYARDDKNASLEGVLYDMMTADILVSSDSSLSHVPAILRTREQGGVIHPDVTNRSRMVSLGWNMLRKIKTGDLWILEAS
jgi:hypothetical protein